MAPDGQTAKVRIRMLQQMGTGARASMGASIYENEAVKEDGVWKFSKVHTMNTMSASYVGGWAKGGQPGHAWAQRAAAGGCAAFDEGGHVPGGV